MENCTHTVMIIGLMSVWVMRPMLTRKETENMFATCVEDEAHSTEIKSLGSGNKQMQV